MTKVLDPDFLEVPSPPLPARLVPVLRLELPGLAEEIVAEVRRAIPDYAEQIDGPCGDALRLGVLDGLTAFVDRIAGLATSTRHGIESTCRRLGRVEAHEGRSMDRLQAAFRVGGQVAWRRIMKIAPKHDLSSSVMSRLADAVFVYLDELVALSLNGYAEARTNPADVLDERRRPLLRLILKDGAVAGAAVTELAGSIGWPVPEQVTMVAARSGARCVPAVLDDDVLLDFEDAAPHLLLPGPLTPARRAMLQAAVPGRQLAAGVTVPWAQAADSLRWAQQALTLADSGIIDGGALIECEHHLVTLWLLSDPELIDQLAQRELAALDGMTPGQRGRITETLGTWLMTQGSVPEIAQRLYLHPQTVRYRMRRIEQTLGERLKDPDARFGIEAVLRMMSLRARMTSTGSDADRTA